MRSRGGSSRPSTIEKRLKADKIVTMSRANALSSRAETPRRAAARSAPFPRFIESTLGRLGERRRFSPGHRTKAFCILRRRLLSRGKCGAALDGHDRASGLVSPLANDPPSPPARMCAGFCVVFCFFFFPFVSPATQSGLFCHLNDDRCVSASINSRSRALSSVERVKREIFE